MLGKFHLVSAILAGCQALSCQSVVLALAQDKAGVTSHAIAQPTDDAVITSKQLKAMLDSLKAAGEKAKAEGRKPDDPNFVLVDVRSEQEMKVSVIPGSISKLEYQKDVDKYRGKQVIVYCLSGGRSAKYAAELKAAGVDVKNFKGSFVEWVTAEYPVVTREGKETNRVYIDGNQFKLPSRYESVK